MKKIRVILAAVLVLALCLSLCGCGAESVAEKYVKASFEEVYSKADKYMLVPSEETNDKMLGNYKIKTQVKRTIELDDDELENLIEMLDERYDTDFYDLSDFVDAKKIKKGVCVKVHYEASGKQIEKYSKEADEELDGDRYVTLVKVGGNWKVVAGSDIMGVFEDDAEDDDE
jgi:hypothetical protein